MSDDEKFIETDYSQIEPRIAAHLTSDGMLINSYAKAMTGRISGLTHNIQASSLAVRQLMAQSGLPEIQPIGANMSEATVRPREALKCIKNFFEMDLAVTLWGGPGTGKSSLVGALAKEMDVPLIDVRAATLDPTDVRGLPTIIGKKTSWTVSDFLPDPEIHGEKGIFFVDELNRAMPLTMNGFFQLIQDRRIGDYVFPAGWKIIAACNRESDGGGVQKMPDALCNRFAHLYMEAHIDDWIPWAVRHKINPMTLAFLKTQPQLLDDYEGAKKANKLTRAFPTPRAWEKVSRITDLNLDKQTNRIMISGLVGEGPALTYVSFLDIAEKLPDLDEIIKNPMKAKVPDQVGALYAISTGLAFKSNKENFGKVLQYLERIDSPEYCVMAVKEACHRDHELKQTQTFQDWVEKYQAVLF